MAEDVPGHDELVVGDYGIGSQGPTIILKLTSSGAAEWLLSMFLRARRSPDGIDLLADPRIRIMGVRELRLNVREGHGPYISLQCTDSSPGGRRFNWSASSEGWAYEAGLLEPFTKGRKGHQYLTREGVDDALIEVFLDEPHVRLPA